MLVTSKELFKKAQKGNYAIPAPNFMNDLSLKTYVECAEDKKLPLLACFAEVHTEFMDIEEAAILGKYYAQKANIPVVLHLDHGMNFDTIMKAIKNGFTSVMIDASSESFDENVRRTKEIVKAAHAVGVVVEAEIGHVGAGENYENHTHTDSIYTEVEEAKKFVELTNVDSLAISIGTAHGAYKGIPKISFDTLKNIRSQIDTPLVLHGGSSSGDENLNRCAISGISKINIFTDLITAGMNEINKHESQNIFEVNNHFSRGLYNCLSHYYDVFQTR